MKETLAKVGRTILRIFLITLILTSIKSCAKAWTFEDFVQFLDSTKSANIPGAAKGGGTYLLAHVNDFKTAVTNNGLNLNDYESFAIKYNSNSTFDSIVTLFVNSPEYTISNYSMQLGNGTTANGRKRIEFWHRVNGTWEKNGPYDNTASDYSRWALTTTAPLSGSYGTQPVMQNYFNYIEVLPRNNLETSNLPWYIADGRIGVINSALNLHFYLKNTSGTINKRLTEATNTSVDGGTLYQLQVPNLIDLVNLDTYYITAQRSGDSTIYSQSIDFVLEWSTSEEETSGEKSGETDTPIIDLTDTNNKIDNVASKIEDTNAILLSGEIKAEERQTFWEKAYNDLFVISGEEITNIIEETMDDIKISSGELEEVNQILTYLQGEPGDFIISWNNMTTHFSMSGEQLGTQLMIPAKQINFSEMERNSEELQQAMTWARIITNISIFSIIIHEAYICILATLGVPVAIYGRKLEEKAQVQAEQQRNEQRWQNKFEEQRYNEWLYNHRKR